MAKSKPSKSKSQPTNNNVRYRKLYAEAKRKGLVAGDKDARSLKPSAYMKTKLNKLQPYLGSDYEAVKVSPNVARAFKETRGNNVPFVTRDRVLVRKQSNEYVTVKHGLPAKIRRLKAGDYEEIIIPVSVKTIGELEAAILNNPYWDDILKNPDENFRFSIGGSIVEGGSPSNAGYLNLEELIAEIKAYKTIEDNGEDDYPIEGSIHLYREYKDWKFPELDAERKRKFKERDEEFTRRQRERRQRKQERLPQSKRDQIARTRYIKKINSPAYLRELEQRREVRKTNTPDVEQKRARDAERKRKARAKAKEQKK
tara:strand:- start:14493 stop:15431 length:939 start_codon:yes stop_codon:yes gene_type:complete